MAIQVLHIITQLELGGAQKHVLTVASQLDRGRYESHLISSHGLLTGEARHLSHVHFTLLPFLTRMPNPIFDLLALIGLVFYMKKKKIQIVHTHSSKAGMLGRWAAKIAGVPVIIHTIHGWGFHDYLRSFFNNAYIFLEKITANITTTLIAVTQSDIQKGLRNSIGRRDQYVLIRYGIDFDSTPRDRRYLEDIKQSLGVGEEKVVGMVACLKPQKNPLDFIKAADLIHQRYPDTKFLLVGNGVLRSAVHKEIKKRKLENDVLMLGWRRDASDIISICEVMVSTSLWEGLPIVFLEAMHLAKPVVAYDVCGVSEVIKDGVNGFLVPPSDTAQLSVKVEQLLADHELRERMGKLGKLFVANDVFSSRKMVEKIEGLYGGL